MNSVTTPHAYSWNSVHRLFLRCWNVTEYCSQYREWLMLASYCNENVFEVTCSLTGLLLLALKSRLRGQLKSILNRQPWNDHAASVHEMVRVPHGSRMQGVQFHLMIASPVSVHRKNCTNLHASGPRISPDIMLTTVEHVEFSLVRRKATSL